MSVCLSFWDGLYIGIGMVVAIAVSFFTGGMLVAAGKDMEKKDKNDTD